MKILKLIAPLGLVTAFFFYSFLPVSLEKKTVEIPYGMSSTDIAMYLYKEGVIRNPLSFLGIHMVKKGKLEAGEYEFDGLIFPWDVYRKIHYGLRKVYKITVPEGSDIYDIANILEMHSICKAKDFLEYALSPKTAERYGLNTFSMEGFLFPDTYFFSKNTHPLTVISVMYRNFLKKTESLREELKKSGMSLEEWVTIASLIEKETALKEEKPLISAVIRNRLKKGMRLQIDPTVIYAMKRKGIWDGKLLSKDLEIDDPYNTYLYFGLPPSPICNPGMDSLEYALYPAKVNYLYFVANGNGGHRFSSTYLEHLANVRAYRDGKR
ncbi:endolytic transglycosylase MltG [Hydrogenobacter thermophilus]|uniref:endolytic transglycosylase MltG n=1 Tax=Hydrogenobacter thermophilus TaxID=940 RepID=UPI0030F5B8AC